MCKCDKNLIKRFGFGTKQVYENQILLKAPSWSEKDFISVDKCLKDEILKIWSAGITTTGCCCGHNHSKPFINVEIGHERFMRKLGYKYKTNIHGVKCFAPHSV